MQTYKTIIYTYDDSSPQSGWQLQQIQIKVLCEQTRELTDDLHDFFDYVKCYLIWGILWLIFIFRVRAGVQCSLM